MCKANSQTIKKVPVKYGPRSHICDYCRYESDPLLASVSQSVLRDLQKHVQSLQFCGVAHFINDNGYSTFAHRLSFFQINNWYVYFLCALLATAISFSWNQLMMVTKTAKHKCKPNCNSWFPPERWIIPSHIYTSRHLDCSQFVKMQYQYKQPHHRKDREFKYCAQYIYQYKQPHHRKDSELNCTVHSTFICTDNKTIRHSEVGGVRLQSGYAISKHCTCQGILNRVRLTREKYISEDMCPLLAYTCPLTYISQVVSQSFNYRYHAPQHELAGELFHFQS